MSIKVYFDFITSIKEKDSKPNMPNRKTARQKGERYKRSMKTSLTIQL